MEKLFIHLGRTAGKAFKKGKWYYNSILGDEEDAVKAEFAIGLEMAKEIAKQQKLKKDEFVKQLGSQIKNSISSRHRFNYYTIKSSESNAFALPGGFIFITDSLLNLCEYNKDEIAFVLGHEMAHVIRGHAMSRILAEYSINAISNLIRTTGLLQNAAKQLAKKYLISSYSRESEFEADLLGTKIMLKAGYKNNGAEMLLNRLNERKENLSAYFSSHPKIIDRINNINEFLNKHS